MGALITAIFWLLLWVYIGISWVVNLIFLVKSLKAVGLVADSVIHLIGVFIPPAAGITVWF